MSRAKVFDSVIINHQYVRLTRGDDFIYCHDAADMLNHMLSALQSFVSNSSVQAQFPSECEGAEKAIDKALGEESGQ